MNIKSVESKANTISPSFEPHSCDVIIIGAGPAGMCAALYLARAKLSVILIGDHTKSLLAKAAVVVNHLGMPDMSGIAMLGEFLSHCKRYGVYHNTLEVTDVRGEDGNFSVKLSDGTSRSSKKIIIATGIAYKHAGIKGEDQLTGKGIAYCVACDGPFFSGKKVAVIGNGTFAAEEALEMLAHTTDVSIVTQGLHLAIGPEYLKLIKDRGIRIRSEKITEARGDPTLREVVFSDGHIEPCDGIFVALGSASAVSFANKLGLEMNGNAIAVDATMQTAAPGVYAIGGAIGGNIQIAKSLGDGCTAAIAIIKGQRGVGFYVDH